MNRLRVLDAFYLPRKAFTQPRVGLLDLVAVVDALVEHAVVVADAVADHRQPQRRAAVEEARREPAEAAIAKTRVHFAIVDILEVETEAPQCFCRFVLQSQVEQGVAQQPAHQELQRQVGNAPGVAAHGGISCTCPALHQSIAGGKHDRLVEEWRFPVNRLSAQHAAEVMGEIFEHRVGRHRQPGRLH